MRRVVSIAVSVIVAVLLGVTANVATGVLPDRWKPFLGLAWPLLVLFVVLTIVIEVRTARAPRNGATAPKRARGILLDRVRRYWIASVLERSLYEEARIELGIEAVTDDRRHPWNVEARDRAGFVASLDDRTSASALFRLLDQAMVIVGAPGSGKTTTLLELARDLLDQAAEDPDAPIPVVFNLSSWAKGRPALDQWLGAQLIERYGIPAGQATAWIADGEILPLLDGLDEVAEEHRDACAAAITAFHRLQPLTPLVICCRKAEYERLRAEPPLYGTVTIQPLDRAQVARYIDRPALTGLRRALDADPELWALTDSPLLLSIMALTFADDPALPDAIRPATVRDRLFARYVETMLRRRPSHRYDPEQTRHYLSELAKALRRDRQTVFLLDAISSAWTGYRLMAVPTVVKVISCLALAVVLGGAGWLWGSTGGLAVAAGLVLLAAAAYWSDAYDDLFDLSFFLRRQTKDHRAGHWLRDFLWELTEMLRMREPPARRTVAAVVSVSTAVGLFVGFSASGTSGPAAGIAYGAGFLTAAIVFFAALESAQSILRYVAPASRGGRRELPSPLLRRRLGFVASGVYAPALAVTLLASFQVSLARGAAEGVRAGVLLGLGVALLLVAVTTLTTAAEQVAVRFWLALHHRVPYPMLPFLDHAVQCLFLRQVGDGYIFVHRELLDYFADRRTAAAQT